VKVIETKRISSTDWNEFFKGTDIGALMYRRSLYFEVDRNAGQSVAHMVDWCNKNCTDQYYVDAGSPHRVYFLSIADKALCLLKFGGNGA